MEKELAAVLSEKLTEGRIVGIAPFVMTLAMKLLSPGYMRPIYETGAGMMVSALSLSLSAAAIIMIERINRIDF
jgi:tight adherence protein B